MKQDTVIQNLSGTRKNINSYIPLYKALGSENSIGVSLRGHLSHDKLIKNSKCEAVFGHCTAALLHVYTIDCFPSVYALQKEYEQSCKNGKNAREQGAF